MRAFSEIGRFMVNSGSPKKLFALADLRAPQINGCACRFALPCAKARHSATASTASPAPPHGTTRPGTTNANVLRSGGPRRSCASPSSVRVRTYRHACSSISSDREPIQLTLAIPETNTCNRFDVDFGTSLELADMVFKHLYEQPAMAHT